jgi:hypothetical protein
MERARKNFALEDPDYFAESDCYGRSVKKRMERVTTENTQKQISIGGGTREC